jgi:hypothetical protein
VFRVIITTNNKVIGGWVKKVGEVVNS